MEPGTSTAPGGTAAQDQIRVLSHVPTRRPVYFITIDDGAVADADALRFVRAHAIPVTVFLTNAAIGGHAAYFRHITAFGGSVQNHTDKHADLTLPGVDVDAEVCGIQRRYERLFGAEPWILRPPYGAGATSTRLHRVAASCGISTILTWDVVVTGTTVEYVRPPLRSGDVVLLHFTSDLAAGLARIYALGVAQGLHPAALTDYLLPPTGESIAP